MNCFGFFCRSLNHGTLEEINVSIMEMPREYSVEHCVAKDMRMSASNFLPYFFARDRLTENGMTRNRDGRVLHRCY